MAMLKPPHPGVGLKDDFEALGLTIAGAAKALGVTRQQVYKVVKADSAISPEMALRLEAVIGSTADHWLRLQNAYDLARTREKSASIKSLRRLSPVNHLASST